MPKASKKLSTKASAVAPDGLLKTARLYHRSGRRSEAIVLLQQAWSQGQTKRRLARDIALEMAACGTPVEAFGMLSAYLSRFDPGAEILAAAAEAARKLGQTLVAEQHLQKAVELKPREPRYALALADLYDDVNRQDACEAVLMSALQRLPKEPQLWNRLGIFQRDRKGAPGDARHSFEQAVQLDPNTAAYANNLGMVQPDAPRRVQWLEKALALEPDFPLAHVGLALAYLQTGRLADAWPHYDHRLDLRLGSERAARYTHGLPIWQGEPLNGRRILLVAEQGIGDEILCASAFWWLQSQGAALSIGCDPRLCTIYQRSFPEATVGAFVDRQDDGHRVRSFPDLEGAGAPACDFALPIGSLLQHIWPSLDALHPTRRAYLRADPALVEQFAGRLSGESSRLKIGLSWRSGRLIEGRWLGYFGAKWAGRLMRDLPADFICLQYSYETSEIETINQEAGDRLIVMDDVDLKDDIEANLAIMQTLDFVIGPTTATQMFALALAKPVYLLSRGYPWWYFGQTHDPVSLAFPHCRNFVAKGGDWGEAVKDLRAFLTAKLKQQ